MYMKRMISFTVVFTLCLALSACNMEQAEDTSGGSITDRSHFTGGLSRPESAESMHTSAQAESVQFQDERSQPETDAGEPSRQESALSEGPPPPESARDKPDPVYIPKAKLPVPSADPYGDVTGVIVYNGDIYHQSLSRTASDQYTDFEALKGDLLGRPVHLSQYADEFREEPLPPIVKFYEENKLVANVLCDVYTVKGYDSGFRLMAAFSSTPYAIRGADGEVYSAGPSHYSYCFYERHNDMWAATGADLFGKLKIRGNIRMAEYDIDSDGGEYGILDIPLSDLEDFVTALYKALYLTVDQVDRQALYQGPSAWLYLVLNDGTIVPLRLFEGGTVSYEFPGFFQMEPDRFDPVFRAIVHIP